jgi:hypothetical protein
MMNRRQALIAAMLGSVCGVAVGDEYQPLSRLVRGVVTRLAHPQTKYVVLNIQVRDDAPVTALEINYNGRTAIVSMDEVMDALGAVKNENHPVHPV